MTMNKLFLTLLIFLAQHSAAIASCTEANYHAFDFWLGHWQVTSKDDDIIRFNHIKKINNGCTILEEYTSSSGYVGKSLNIYDLQTQLWHQTWTDSTGLLLQLSGAIEDDSMVMVGETTLKDNHNTMRRTLNRIRWTPNADGSVRQHWQVSQDHGETWKTAFDGLYEKVTIK
jgi:hypothetical protein